jgi:hypothetical protein
LSDCCATGGSVSGSGSGRFADTFAPADPSLFDLSPTGKTGAGSVAADSPIAGWLMLGSAVPPHPANANVSVAIADAASIPMRQCAGLIKSSSSARHALTSFFMVLSFGFVEVRYSIEDDVAAAISKGRAHLFR